MHLVVRRARLCSGRRGMDAAPLPTRHKPARQGMAFPLLGSRAPYSAPSCPRDSNILRIATYNVRTLSQDIHLEHLEKELSHIIWDIVGISEVRRPGEALMQLNSGHLLYSKGQDKKQGGVGLLIHRNIKPYVIGFDAISDRVITVRLQLSKHIPLQVTQIYAPTSMSSQDEIEVFYDDLQKVTTKNANVNIILGDFNAKVGNCTGLENCLGRFGLGNRNARGEDLINFATCHQLKIMNTFFKKSIRRKWTWHSPNFEHFNEIDYVLTNRPDVIKDVRTISRVDVGSDHRMVMCKMSINWKRERSKKFKIKQKPFCLDKIDVSSFRCSIENELEHVNDPSTDVNQLYRSLISPLLNVASRYSTTTVRPGIFSQKTIDLMRKKKSLPVPITRNQKAEFAELHKLIRKSQRDDKRKHQFNIINEIANQGKGFKAINSKLQPGKLHLVGVQERDGSVTQDRNRIIQRAREFYAELYSSDPYMERSDPYVERYDSSSDAFPQITKWEVENAIKTSKIGKASGPDGVGMDLLKAAGSVIYDRLAVLFNKCLERRCIPDEWNDATIILLHKKGNPKDMNNYRPISLLNCVYKIFTKIVTTRIEQILDENQPVEQAGFRRGFSTVDHLQVINQIIEKSQEYQIPLVLAFVDYAKAFDSVETSAILKSIQNQGVDRVYVEMFGHIYTNARAHIRLDRTSEPFSIAKGVRQGDTSSPKLFTAILENVFRSLDWSEKGVVVDGKCLNHLRFADDIVLFSKDSEQLQAMLNELDEAGKSTGLKVNHHKTKIMKNSFVLGDRSVVLNNQSIECVDKYIYLGQLISMNSSKEDEIKRRINLGWRAFGKVSWILKDHSISLGLRRKLYDRCILPTIVYGAETWNLTSSLAMKLRSMQRAHERLMLGVSLRDHKTAIWIREKTKLTDVLESIYKRKWRWAGHVARMADDRWTSRVTFWTPYGHRRRPGRQKMRWRDDIEKSYKLWHQLARDRQLWKSWEEAYVRQRTS